MTEYQLQCLRELIRAEVVAGTCQQHNRVTAQENANFQFELFVAAIEETNAHL